MTKLTNDILKNLEFIKESEDALEMIEDSRSIAHNETLELIHRLTYDECIMLIDKSIDMPEKIFDEILKRARYLWRARE